MYALVRIVKWRPFPGLWHKFLSSLPTSDTRPPQNAANADILAACDSLSLYDVVEGHGGTVLYTQFGVFGHCTYFGQVKYRIRLPSQSPHKSSALLGPLLDLLIICAPSAPNPNYRCWKACFENTAGTPLPQFTVITSGFRVVTSPVWPYFLAYIERR